MTSISLSSIIDAATNPFSLGQQAETRTQVTETEAEGTGDPMEDYVVELSEAARKLAQSENPYTNALNNMGGIAAGGLGEDEEEEDDSVVSKLKERIQKLNEEIREIQNDQELSDEEKQKQLALKQSELAELQFQLQEAMEAEAAGTSQVGGASILNTGSLT